MREVISDIEFSKNLIDFFFFLNQSVSVFAKFSKNQAFSSQVLRATSLVIINGWLTNC